MLLEMSGGTRGWDGVTARGVHRLGGKGKGRGGWCHVLAVTVTTKIQSCM